MHDDADNPEHFHPGPDAIVEDIEGVEMFSLTSVGIDIGSSTSHLVFSHLTLRREGAGLSARFRVTDREVLYRSPIMLTPYSSGTLIDTAKVEDFIHESYRVAGYTHDDIDTGAVVITGEALNKENSRPILEYFAKDSGKFICASPDPTTKRCWRPTAAARWTCRNRPTPRCSTSTWAAAPPSCPSSGTER